MRKIFIDLIADMNTKEQKIVPLFTYENVLHKVGVGM